MKTGLELMINDNDSRCRKYIGEIDLEAEMRSSEPSCNSQVPVVKNPLNDKILSIFSKKSSGHLHCTGDLE